MALRSISAIHSSAGASRGRRVIPRLFVIFPSEPDVSRFVEVTNRRGAVLARPFYTICFKSALQVVMAPTPSPFSFDHCGPCISKDNHRV